MKTKTTITIYFDQGRGWMCYSRRVKDGAVMHEDYSPSGMPRDSFAEEVARRVADCNPGCDVEVEA